MGKVVVEVGIQLDKLERETIQEAFLPFRVNIQGRLDEAQEQEQEHIKLFQRLRQRVLKPEWVREAHTHLGHLRTALIDEARFWEREAARAPKEGKGLIARPKEVIGLLAETRTRQADLCRQALKVLRSALVEIKVVKSRIAGGEK